MNSLIASIPSPSSGILQVGPIRLTAYGLMIALGVVAAVHLAGKRLAERGAGTSDDMNAIALWAVLGGVAGARLYHVVTDWSKFGDDLGRIPLIWKGGLGIPGGLLGGVAFGLLAARRRGLPLSGVIDAAVPAIPLGQAIGRWGNWWNQELFGRPTDLPWGLEIDESKVPRGVPIGSTFHPTFLYESMWNLLLCTALIWIDRRFRLRPGRLLPLYLIGYFSGRFWIEGLRVDSAHVIGGLRLNQWVALTVVIVASAYLVVDWYRNRRNSAPIEEVSQTVEHERAGGSVVG